MSRGVRLLASLAALSGLLGTTAFGAVTALHVLLEHDTPDHAAAHAHHAVIAAPEDHGHRHEAEPAAAVHPRAGADDALWRDEAPTHRHPSLLTAELQVLSGRASADRVASAPPGSSAPLPGAIQRASLGPASRAGPTTPPSARSRGSVVLQV